MKRYKKFFEERYNGNAQFHKLNKRLFHNEIPSDYKVVRQSLESSFILGYTSPIEHIIVLNKNQMPTEMLDLVLIHEMIHALLYEQFGKAHADDPHGAEFQKERKRISRIYEYEIPEKEDLSSLMKIMDDLGIE